MVTVIVVITLPLALARCVTWYSMEPRLQLKLRVQSDIALLAAAFCAPAGFMRVALMDKLHPNPRPTVLDCCI